MSLVGKTYVCSCPENLSYTSLLFSPGVGMEDACGWGWVLAAVQVPDLTQEDFVSECISQGSYLTLFAHVLQQLPLCQSPQNEFTMLKALVGWTAKVRPRSVGNKRNEKCELWLLFRRYGSDTTGFHPALAVIMTISWQYHNLF